MNNVFALFSLLTLPFPSFKLSFAIFSYRSKDKEPAPIPRCNRTIHELFVCRAKAWPCANELRWLQSCIEKGAENECKDQQIDVGKCITKYEERYKESHKGKLPYEAL
jgi:hypothetical protein